jgi:hypothetical protein
MFHPQWAEFNFWKLKPLKVLNNWKRKCQPIGIKIENTFVYTLNYADGQVLLAQDHDDMEYMARKLRRK